MTTTTIAVKTASAADEAAAIAVLTLAFSADPVLRWLYPDPHQYLAHFPELTRAFAGKAFVHGSAHYIDGYVGAALWLPPDVHPDEEALGAILQSSLSEQKQGEVFAVFEQMGAYHPSEPHWYLPVIGIDPTQQGKGYGSALLRHALEQCDRDQKLAYLESSNPRNNPLYERLGFEVIGTIQVGDSPPFWPMLRKPR